MARTLRAIASKLGLEPIAVDLNARWKYSRNRALRESNRVVVAAGAPDGSPLPPPFLAYKVARSFDLRSYLEGGAVGATCIEEALQTHGVDLATLGAVLDWGCGSGRVARHVSRRTSGKFYGCDYNPQLVRWCQSALSFGEFQLCGPTPPLPYPDAKFDLVYSISVLTHIPATLQVPWLAEIRRVLRPGGHALLSVHGASRVHRLAEAEKRRFERGGLVVVAEEYPGTNLCGVFHPESYIRTELAAVMPLLAILPEAARDAQQDFLLFEKR